MKKKFLLAILTAASISPAFAKISEGPNAPITYKNNIIRFSPLKVYDMGVGLGLSYERHLDKEQKVSIILPIDMALVNSYFSQNNMYSSNKVNNYFYFSPGIKFYPSGQKRVNYGIGANLVLGVGRNIYSTGYYDQSYNWIYREEELPHYRMGMMVNNYLNFNLSNKFNIGIDLGLGAIYINQHKNQPNEGITVTGNVGFSMGFRF